VGKTLREKKGNMRGIIVILPPNQVIVVLPQDANPKAINTLNCTISGIFLHPS